MKFKIILIIICIILNHSNSLNISKKKNNSFDDKSIVDKSVENKKNVLDVIENKHNSDYSNKNRNSCNISEINVSYADSESSPVLVFKTRVEDKEIKFTVLSKQIHEKYVVKNTKIIKEKKLKGEAHNYNENKIPKNKVWLIHKHDDDIDDESENEFDLEKEDKNKSGNKNKKYRDAFTYCRKLNDELLEKYNTEEELLNAHKDIINHDKINHFSKRKLLL